ncbi:NAD(P)-binding protein [Wolfiporia cocos MD-104 SS10]|uniref:NAD(P)-binding protein n=1 Tax=Wolfiporia cocos (strain MD-104) TaxID=742152 RepID=A0A2H3JSX1_WOLCO|nr:NAD(P)-binding protein [Wolfiporia cocos MD-104 SS10]
MGGFFEELRYIVYIIAQLFPGKPKFSTAQIPDLTGQVMVVTGGNVGIGRETVKALLEHNAKVYMASRNKDKAFTAIKELKDETGREAIFLELDLSDLSSVRRAATQFLSMENELHVLFNNAGVMSCPIDWLSPDGYDMQFATNVIGHFFFSKLLLPALFAGTATSPDHHARIIMTSSSAAYLHTINWDSFVDGPERRKMTPQQLYAQSKLADAVLAREFAKRFSDQSIIAISLNPGSIDTELQRHVSGTERKFLRTFLLGPLEYGALNQLWAGTVPEALNYNGKFLVPWTKVGECRKEAYDDGVGSRLWDWLEHQVENK